jgi:hypothetical protein
MLSVLFVMSQAPVAHAGLYNLIGSVEDPTGRGVGGGDRLRH